MSRGGLGAGPVRAVLVAVLAALALAPPAAAKVVREGILQATVTDFANDESTTDYSLRSGRQVTPVLPTAPVRADSGDRVVVRGAMHGETLVGSVADDGGDDGDDGSRLSIGPIVGGPRRVAVIHFTFPGDAAEPWPVQRSREEIFTGAKSADAFFREESHGWIDLEGKLDPDGDLFGWYRIDAPAGGCQITTWQDQAMGEAVEDGVLLGGYQHIVFVFPYQPSCPWFGQAHLGGMFASINVPEFVSDRRPQVIAHELGHNLGMTHAGSWTCTRNGATVQISNSCTVTEYGDPFDTMGNSSMRHNNAFYLQQVGVIGLTNNIETVEADGTYAIKSAFSPSPVPRVLRIPRTKNGLGNVTSWYYVEIRQQGGLFENFADATMSGVSIRATAAGSAETLLVDANPSTPGDFRDAPLGVGKTFTDSHVRVTTLAAGGGTASGGSSSATGWTRRRRAPRPTSRRARTPAACTSRGRRARTTSASPVTPSSATAPRSGRARRTASRTRKRRSASTPTPSPPGTRSGTAARSRRRRR